MSSITGANVTVVKCSPNSRWLALDFKDSLASPEFRNANFYLRVVDALIVVVDPQPDRMEDTIRLLDRIRQMMEFHRMDESRLPVVFQVNKVDLAHVLPLESVREMLAWSGPSEFVPSIAIQRVGVVEAVAAAVHLIDMHRADASAPQS